jgi:hypothetical protein
MDHLGSGRAEPYHRELAELVDALVDDDGCRVLAILNMLDTPNVTLRVKKWRLPGILRGGASAASLASIAAFFGAVRSFRVFINLGFAHSEADSRVEQCHILHVVVAISRYCESWTIWA